MPSFSFDVVEPMPGYRQADTGPNLRITVVHRSLLHWVLLVVTLIGWALVVWRWQMRIVTSPPDRIFEIPIALATLIALA